MADPRGTRTTDSNIASYRRLVYRRIIDALRSVFDPGPDVYGDPQHYTRDRQLDGLKITQEYPLKKIDYPCIVVQYQSSGVYNAGVGHEEWFYDPDGIWRKWNHSRFEGTLYFYIYALSTLDRDIVADALVEVIRFGRLESDTEPFFRMIYPEGDSDFLNLEQLMLDSDQVRGGSDSASLAPWQPEDVLVYSTSYSVELHGGYYNTHPKKTWPVYTAIEILAYPTDDYGGLLTKFPDYAGVGWNPPRLWTDAETIHGTGTLSGAPFVFTDSRVITGTGLLSGIEYDET